MAEQNRGGRGRRGGRGGRGRGFVPVDDDSVRERNLADIEVEYWRTRAQGFERRAQELERQLAGTGLNNPEEEEDDSITEEEVEMNPFGVLDHTRNRDWRGGNFHNFGMKIEIPEFEGRAQPDDFIDWLHTVERFFDLHEPSEAQKVKLVAIKLRKHASIWWEHVKKQRSREGKSKVETWVKMKKLLQKKFLPEQYKQESWVQYHAFKQGSMTVEQYTAEFDRLRMRCDVVEEDEQTIARYLEGLKSEVSDVVYLQQWFTYNDVCRLALKVEGQLKRKGTKFVSRFPAREAGGKAVAAGSGSTSKGTTTKSVPKDTSGSRNPTAAKRCFKCQGIGHFVADCPNRQIVALVEEDSVPVYDESDGEEDADDEVIYADSGEALVIRRILNASISDDDSY